MTAEWKPVPIDLDKLKSIIGSPALLTTESEEKYDAMFVHYMEALKPKDFFVQMLVKDLVHYDWECLRFQRQKALAILRRNRKIRELELTRIEKNKRRKSCQEENDKPETENEKLFGLELEVQALSDDCIKIADTLLDPPLEVTLSQAMEEGCDYYETLDRLENNCQKRRISILEQIRLYDEVLYLRSRCVADEFVQDHFMKEINERKMY
jgi:hypothetical protein